jgi:tripartite-type tricarboxylate transporter receptor subunit TctC
MQFSDTRSARRALLLALATTALPSQANIKGLNGWPNKPIKLIVAFPPGGLTDTLARIYAAQLTVKLGAQVVVENKPGAGAVVAIDALAKSPPDGYTLLLTTSGTVWQNRVLYTKLPYNLDKDIVPAVVFPSGPLVVGVPEALPVKNMPEFVAYARKNPTSMGTYGPGSYPHMLADQINKTEGTKIVPVHYRGEAAMWLDLANGQTQIALSSYQGFATIQSRGVRAIGVTGKLRSPRLSQLPTLVEQGVGGRLVTLDGALPLMVPAGTPEPIIQALSQVAVEAADSPRASQVREQFSIPDKPKRLAEMRKTWAADVPVWIKLAVDLGIKLD